MNILPIIAIIAASNQTAPVPDHNLRRLSAQQDKWISQQLIHLWKVGLFPCGGMEFILVSEGKRNPASYSMLWKMFLGNVSQLASTASATPSAEGDFPYSKAATCRFTKEEALRLMPVARKEVVRMKRMVPVLAPELYAVMECTKDELTRQLEKLERTVRRIRIPAK
ncbi:hypothetical protein [Fimbriimonas ginsengisoli]|nr:hypothetical protein [Fimbriimonas ginsengisoli]